jgi:hypothetical protein
MAAVQGSATSVIFSDREVQLVDAALARYVPFDRLRMSASDREMFNGIRRVLRRARKAYECAEADWMSDDGHADMTLVELPAESPHDLEVGTAEAVRMLSGSRREVSQRHIARLAAKWADEGLARFAGGSWLIAVSAVEAYRDNGNGGMA